MTVCVCIELYVLLPLWRNKTINNNNTFCDCDTLVQGELGLPDRFVLLLHHPVDDRVRRRRSGHRYGSVVVAREARPVRALARVRTVADRHVLQPHAGRSPREVQVDRTQARTAQGLKTFRDLDYVTDGRRDARPLQQSKEVIYSMHRIYNLLAAVTQQRDYSNRIVNCLRKDNLDNFK